MTFAPFTSGLFRVRSPVLECVLYRGGRSIEIEALAGNNPNALQPVQGRIVDVVRRIVLQQIGEAGEEGRRIHLVNLLRRRCLHVYLRVDYAPGRLVIGFTPAAQKGELVVVLKLVDVAAPGRRARGDHKKFCKLLSRGIHQHERVGIDVGVARHLVGYPSGYGLRLRYLGMRNNCGAEGRDQHGAVRHHARSYVTVSSLRCEPRFAELGRA